MGTFAYKVRHGKVTGPRKSTFTLDKWETAYKDFSSGDAVDLALYNSGKYIYTKLKEIRKTLSQSTLPKLDKHTRIKALISAANHQYEAMEIQLKSQTPKLLNNPEYRGKLPIHEIANVQIKMADGISNDANSVLGGLLDGISLPIASAIRDKSILPECTFNDVNWQDVINETNFGILYRQAESLWEDCVWNQYSIIVENGNIIAKPSDINTKRGVISSRARKLALNVEGTISALEEISSKKNINNTSKIKEISSIKTKGEEQKIEFSEKSIDPISQAMLTATRKMACPPYFESILNDSHASLAGASLTQLLDAWMVVTGAARKLWETSSYQRKSKSANTPKGVSDMTKYIPFFTADALVSAIHEATDATEPQAQAIVEFLTYQGIEKQEFWTQPLVRADSSSKIYPIFGAVAAPSNLNYVLERWMAQLKVKLDERGGPFEAHLRNFISKSISSSFILSKKSKSVTEDFTLRFKDGSSAQIDAIFCIGSTIFVVEAKCILEPTDSTGTGTHRAAIEHAIEQARFRVDLVNKNKSEFMNIMKQYDWDLQPDFSILPIVAVSTVAHAGIPWDGVPVVDERILASFFSGGFQDALFSTKNFNVHTRAVRLFYRDAAEAEKISNTYFLSPPHLQKYHNQLSERTAPIYQISSDDWGGHLVDIA